MSRQKQRDFNKTNFFQGAWSLRAAVGDPGAGHGPVSTAVCKALGQVTA